MYSFFFLIFRVINVCLFGTYSPNKARCSIEIEILGFSDETHYTFFAYC